MNELNNKQIKAIGYLISGLNDSETAEKVGVTRETINNWKNKNYYFRAELNKLQNGVLETIINKQRDLILKAYQVIDKNLTDQLNSEDTDIKTAIEIIKTLKISDQMLETNAEILENRDISKKNFYKDFL